MVKSLSGSVPQPHGAVRAAHPGSAIVFLQDQDLKCLGAAEIPVRANDDPVRTEDGARSGHPKRSGPRSGRPSRTAVRIRRKYADEARYDEPTTESLRDAPGRIAGLNGMLAGAAGRTPGTAALATAAARLAAVERIARVGTWEWDLRNGCGAWSDEIYRILGLTRDGFEPTRSSLLALLHPADAAAVRRAVRDALRGRRPYDLQFRIQRRDGLIRHLHVLAEITCDAAGRAVGMLGTAQDITAAKRTELHLRADERRLQRAHAIARIGWFEYALAGGRGLWSEECYRIWGRRPGDFPVTIHSVLGTVHPADRRRVAEILCDPAGFERFQFRILRADGAWRDIVCEGALEIDREGRPVRLSGICRDVTDRIASEEALRQAKEQAEAASAAKTRFLAAASHDLRQPLQAGILFHDILVRRNCDSGLDDIIAGLGQSLAAQQAMLAALLDISRLDAGIVVAEPRDFPIGVLLDRLIGEFAVQAEAGGLDLRRVACTATVHSDPHLIERMLRNLLSNAIKFTDTGRVLLGCRRAGRLLRVQVHDTGIGIPADQIPRIFDEFHRLDAAGAGRDGMGLGLAIVHRLAVLLGHKVSVRSIPGRGTRFEILVPLAERPLPSAACAPRGARRGLPAGPAGSS